MEEQLSEYFEIQETFTLDLYILGCYYKLLRD